MFGSGSLTILFAVEVAAKRRGAQASARIKLAIAAAGLILFHGTTAFDFDFAGH
jgi:hypothetical protein